MALYRIKYNSGSNTVACPADNEPPGLMSNSRIIDWTRNNFRDIIKYIKYNYDVSIEQDNFLKQRGFVLSLEAVSNVGTRFVSAREHGV
jgi:hypothetical protein